MRLVLLSSLPVLTISLLLSLHMVQTRMDDIYQSLLKQGQLIVHNLAPVCEFAIFAGDDKLLRTLASNTLLDPMVTSVTIFAADRSMRVQLTSEQHDGFSSNGPAARTPNTLSFSEPVYQTGVAVDPFNTDRNPDIRQRPVIGWVKVELSQVKTIRKRQEVFRNGLGIGLLGAMISILIGLRLGRQISRPILNLTQAIERMQQGDLDTRVHSDSKDELATLEQGFNDMADAIRSSQHVLNYQIHQATRQLRQNLTELARKNIELDDARKHAMAMGKEKTNFLVNMSHEIRTPLNAILGYNNLLNKTGLSTQQKEYSQVVTQASRQLLSVIDDVLNFSRLEAGKVILESVSFSLLECCENAIAMMSPVAIEKELDLALIFKADLSEVMIGDPNRLMQIMVNLISNALKFTELGHVAVTVKPISQADRDIISIQVSDTGIGMSQDAQGHIFAQFQQGDHSITRRFGGTGLGLAIVTKLTQLMAGKIEVRSTEGQGTRFTLSLPMQRSGPHAGQQTISHLKGLRCLLYDASEIEREALRTLLASWQLDVIMVTHLHEVAPRLQQARQHGTAIDIVLGGFRLRQNDIDTLAECLLELRQYYEGPVTLLLNQEKQAHDPKLTGDKRTVAISRPVRHKLLYERLCVMTHRTTNARTPQDLHYPGPPPATAVKGLRILLAEDNELNSRLVTTWMEQKGADVITAHDGHHALSIACTEPLDLVLLDIHLPKIDGIELAKQIRKVSGSISAVPIIVLTADIYRGRRDTLEQASINGCLFKPLDEQALWDCITDVLQGQASPRCWPGQNNPGQYREKRLQDQERHPPTADLDPYLPEVIKALNTASDRIAAALKTSDREAIRKHSHEMSGMAGIFAQTRIARAAAAMEGAIHQGAEMDALERLYSQLSDTIDALLQKQADTLNAPYD